MVDSPSCGAAPLANSLVVTLLDGKNFDVPFPDLDDPIFQIPPIIDLGTIVALTNEDLTTRQVDGSGTFDALMNSISNHLKSEFDKQRITGQEYTKAYIAAMGASLQGAVQFLLGRDTAHWQSVLIQQQAIAAQIKVVQARVELETAKVGLAMAQFQALTAESTYALTKMKVATEDATYCGVLIDNETKQYSFDNILPLQKQLVSEQVEVQRAQTLDVRTDGIPITGSVGKQKDLYNQQIISYQRDAEVKAAKLFTDAWITQKTLDEGLLAPAGFQNASLDTILTALKLNNHLN